METALAEKFELALNQSVYLGPARVMTASPEKVKVAVRDQFEWATIAVAYPYQPRPGDTVLVISQGERCYIIGILSGNGDTVLSVPADLKLKAPHGTIELVASERIRLRSPEVSVNSKTLRVIVNTVRETFDNATRTVKEAYEIFADSLHTMVNEDYRLRANRIRQRAKNDIKVDARKIHLG